MSRSPQQIQDWMIDRLSYLLGVAPQEIDPREPIRRYGLDSVALVAFIADLEEWLNYRFHSNPLNDDSTLETLAAFLAEQTATPKMTR
ncbi:MAG TPA: acyl carrier protein [Gemmataceae bacterium]|nr:acyl carrier protein [Gemmataceae bacterium]